MLIHVKQRKRFGQYTGVYRIRIRIDPQSLLLDPDPHTNVDSYPQEVKSA
jgi:hypothetical protein